MQIQFKEYKNATQSSIYARFKFVSTLTASAVREAVIKRLYLSEIEKNEIATEGNNILVSVSDMNPRHALSAFLIMQEAATGVELWHNFTHSSEIPYKDQAAADALSFFMPLIIESKVKTSEAQSLMLEVTQQKYEMQKELEYQKEIARQIFKEKEAQAKTIKQLTAKIKRIKRAAR